MFCVARPSLDLIPLKLVMIVYFYSPVAFLRRIYSILDYMFIFLGVACWLSEGPILARPPRRKFFSLRASVIYFELSVWNYIKPPVLMVWPSELFSSTPMLILSSAFMSFLGVFSMMLETFFSSIYKSYCNWLYLLSRSSNVLTFYSWALICKCWSDEVVRLAWFFEFELFLEENCGVFLSLSILSRLDLAFFKALTAALDY